MTEPGRPTLFVDRLEAVVFDTEVVLPDTASVHAAAWRRLFDEYLMRRASQCHEPFRAFTEGDYLRHVDGRSRDDGVAGFLASRGIALPWGDPADPGPRDGLRARQRQGPLLHRPRRTAARRPPLAPAGRSRARNGAAHGT